MQTPVANRKAITAQDDGSKAKISRLVAAANSAEARKKRRGSIRSARLNKALIRVPTTNPA